MNTAQVKTLSAYAWEAYKKGKSHKRIATIWDSELNGWLSGLYGWHTDSPVYEVESRNGSFYLRYNWNLNAWQVGLDEHFLK